MRPTTLCFPVREDGKILLGRKKRGFGVSKWNGFGGKIEKGEDFLQCAVRELREETGLIAKKEDLEFTGFLDFHFSASPELNHIGYVYFLHRWNGTVEETEEMEPHWFDPKDFPYDEMWKGDRTWIPMLLKGEKVKGIITFAADNDSVAKMEFSRIRAWGRRRPQAAVRKGSPNRGAVSEAD